MARRDFPLNIDRRRLLAAGAAVATAAIALRADRVDAALADTAQLPALTTEVPPRMFAPPRLGYFSKSPGETNFAGEQSCPFCRLQNSYAG
jgi:hypothetical protein